MPDTIDETNTATPPTPPVEDNEASRGRGRPSIAELEARKAALDSREEDLKRRELEAELAAAEANQALRERDLEARTVAAGRTGGLRAGNLRSDNLSEPVRGRKYKGGADMPNKFDVPREQIPDGMSYQWNNATVFGKSDPSYDSFMAQQGWEPVPAYRHPHLVPPGTPENAPIIIDGQVLVERPAELTNEALQEELDKARGEVRAKEDQLYGARPDTPVGRGLGIKKDFERPTAELPRGNYQYETPGQGGQVIE